MGRLINYNRLKKTKEFQYLYKKGKYTHKSSFVLFYLKGSELKIGFTATKKIGNAVARNRAKRRLRALFYETRSQLKLGTYVLVAKEAILTTAFNTIYKDYKNALNKQHLL